MKRETKLNKVGCVGLNRLEIEARRQFKENLAKGMDPESAKVGPRNVQRQIEDLEKELGIVARDVNYNLIPRLPDIPDDWNPSQEFPSPPTPNLIDEVKQTAQEYLDREKRFRDIEERLSTLELLAHKKLVEGEELKSNSDSNKKTT